MLVSLFILISATFSYESHTGRSVYGREKPSPEILARLMEQYDLDKPVFQQYTKYLGNIVQGDFGLSMKKQGQSVTDIIVDTFGPSLRLGLIAIVVSVIVGVLLGMLATLYHRKLIDNIAMIISVLGIAVPSFVLASLLQYVLAEKAGIFNVMGFEGPLDYVLPVMALSAQPIAFIARLTRSSMLEVFAFGLYQDGEG